MSRKQTPARTGDGARPADGVPREGIVPATVEIRPATPDDANALAELWLRARAASVPTIPPPVHSEEEVRRWFAAVVVPERDVLVATADERAVGLLVLAEGSVDQLYVEPNLTGRGIGSLLLGAAKAHAPGGLELWTFEANAGARRFYERHGFVATERRSDHSEEGAPDLRYRWP